MGRVSPKSTCFFTLGCKVNQSEFAMISDVFELAGIGLVFFDEAADLMIVNSCALTEFAEAKTRRTIRDFKTRNTCSRICVTA